MGMKHTIDLQNLSHEDCVVDSVFASCNTKRLIATINLSSKKIQFFVEYNNSENLDQYSTLTQAILAYNQIS